MTFEERVKELKDFEREEGVPLPMFPTRIIELEDQGFVVDLVTGQVYSNVTVQTTKHAKAVAYLLSERLGR